MPGKWLDKRELAEKLREVRLVVLGGISQEELARRVGRPRSQGVISKLETGSRAPEPKILMDIAALIGEGPDYFQVPDDGQEQERRDKLVVAAWLEGAAKRLRAAATSPSGDAKAPDDPEAARAKAEAEKRREDDTEDQQRA